MNVHYRLKIFFKGAYPTSIRSYNQNLKNVSNKCKMIKKYMFEEPYLSENASSSTNNEHRHTGKAKRLFEC